MCFELLLAMAVGSKHSKLITPLYWLDVALLAIRAPCPAVLTSSTLGVSSQQSDLSRPTCCSLWCVFLVN